jgi:hypothetical protein
MNHFVVTSVFVARMEQSVTRVVITQMSFM